MLAYVSGVYVRKSFTGTESTMGYGCECHRTRRQVPKTLYKQSHQSRHFIISRSTVCILTTSCTGGEEFEGLEQPRSCCRTRRSPEFSRTVAVLEVSAVFCTSSFLGNLPLDHFYWSCSMEYDCILRHQPSQKLCAALWNGMTKVA